MAARRRREEAAAVPEETEEQRQERLTLAPAKDRGWWRKVYAGRSVYAHDPVQTDVADGHVASVWGVTRPEPVFRLGE